MFYTYILKNEKDDSFYYGYTEDLKRRLVDHNSGKVKYTSAHTPYVLVWYCAFTDKEKAMSFEKYLKSLSGHAFSRKRFL